MPDHQHRATTTPPSSVGMTSTPRPLYLPNGIHRVAAVNGLQRRATSMTRDASSLGTAVPTDEDEREDDPIHQLLRARYEESEALLESLFNGNARPKSAKQNAQEEGHTPAEPATVKTAPTPKRPARHIVDDYGDDDDEEDLQEDESQDADEDDDVSDLDKQSPLKLKSKAALQNGGRPSISRAPTSVPGPDAKTGAADSAKTSEEVRKQLEAGRKAAAEHAKRSFQAAFYSFEYDKDAMLEQQKLDDLDREVESELAGDQPNGVPTSAPNGTSGAVTHGTLASADLGASSLTLKHLIARIEQKREMVRASDNQLRTLISEVRKGRSKWASEDRIGQEELYEAAEKVLLELKAMTDYAQPFLTRVSKREAPDYFQVIRTPMDIGTMLKKLKQLQYKSKADFVGDLNLIWSNCLRYNSSPDHPFRKKALYMRKETDKLIPLIPEVVVKDRAEAEAEERRNQAGDVDDSDDDDAPIMASRGRKAPKKGSKGGPTSSARKAPSIEVDDSKTTPDPEAKPLTQQLSAVTNLKHDHLRAESEMDGTSLGFSTPPPGTATPIGLNGVSGGGAPGSQVDLMEVDGGSAAAMPEDLDEEDTEFKTWKQVTMKDRAQAAAERNRLFAGDRLNPEEPALLRTKAGMRRWMRQQKMLDVQQSDEDGAQDEEAGGQETLAEGIDETEDSTLPDYYSPLSHIPEMFSKFKWTTDSEGFAISQSEAHMRLLPSDTFKPTPGPLTVRMEGNMRQMQETRKIVAKIGIVKQMQIQAQTYQNQFQKYDPEPFAEKAVPHIVVSEEGPVMAPWLCRAAFQRTVGKIFYHAGFEDFQPSALEAVTDLASEYFAKLVTNLKTYAEQPPRSETGAAYTAEEQILHTLHENGQDLESLETYVKDDVERLTSKLGIVHERMKAHLADLLRPALGDHAGADGVGAFDDGSEQFVGGDFAEDLDEDFFGFRELGLADELGLETLSVPLHLLQNRLHSGYQAQHQGVSTSSGLTFEPPPTYEALTQDNLSEQIGLVQDFFRGRLRANHGAPLVEDEDLPQKQRFPKPRLPPTGKISSPRKRPIKEQQQAAKKKRKLDEDTRLANSNGSLMNKLRLEMPKKTLWMGDPEKENGQGDAAMMSPESLTAN